MPGPRLTPPIWKVQTYQINVGAGDASIHLKLELKADKKTYQIANAILMDGGKISTAHNQIQQTISKIETQYGIPELLFDAVVISHWHGDHFRGLLGFIDQLMDEAVEELRANHKAKQKKATKPIDDLTPEQQQKALNKMTIRHFTKNTTFYFPKPTSGRAQFGGDPKQACRPVEGIRYKKKTPQLSFRLGARVQSIEALGYDLFTNQFILTGQPADAWKRVKNLTNLRKMLDKSSLANERGGVAVSAPAFVCIAIDKYLMGDPASPLFLHSRDGQPTVMPGDTSIHRISTVPMILTASNSKNDLTNATSLACLLLWTGNQRAFPETTISLYTAGDLRDQEEKAVARWITDQGGQKVAIDCIKLSHHGSVTSTSLSMLDLTPRRILISAGTQHNHPCEFLRGLECLPHASQLTVAFCSAPGMIAAVTAVAGPANIKGMRYPLWLAECEAQKSVRDQAKAAFRAKPKSKALERARDSAVEAYEKLLRGINLEVYEDTTDARDFRAWLVKRNVDDWEESPWAARILAYQTAQHAFNTLPKNQQVDITVDPQTGEETERKSQRYIALRDTMKAAGMNLRLSTKAEARQLWSNYCVPNQSNTLAEAQYLDDTAYLLCEFTAQDSDRPRPIKLLKISQADINTREPSKQTANASDKAKRTGKTAKKLEEVDEEWTPDGDDRAFLWLSTPSPRPGDALVTPAVLSLEAAFGDLRDAVTSAMPRTGSTPRQFIDQEIVLTPSLLAWLPVLVVDAKQLHVSGVIDTVCQVTETRISMFLGGQLASFTTNPDSILAQGLPKPNDYDGNQAGYSLSLRGQLFALDNASLASSSGLTGADLLGLLGDSQPLPSWCATVLTKLSLDVAKSGNRCAIFCLPLPDWRAALRLGFEVKDRDRTEIQKWIREALGANAQLQSLQFSVTKEISAPPQAGEPGGIRIDPQASLAGTVVFSPADAGSQVLSFVCAFGVQYASFSFNLDGSNWDLGRAVRWLTTRISSFGLAPPSDLEDTLKMVADHFVVRQLVIRLVGDPVTAKPKLAMIHFRMEIKLKLGQSTAASHPSGSPSDPPRGSPSAFVGLDWDHGQIRLYGSIDAGRFNTVTEEPGPALMKNLLSNNEPIILRNGASHNEVQLSSLIPASLSPDVNIGTSGLPSGVPQTISSASISVEFGPTARKVNLSGVLIWQPQEAKNDPVLRIDELDINLSFNLATKAIYLQLYGRIILTDHFRTRQSEELEVEVDYVESKWSLTGWAPTLNMASLWSLFEADARDAVCDMLINVTITDLKLSWAPDATHIQGSLNIGSILRLSLQYEWTGAGQWSFIAKLEIQEGKVRLGEALHPWLHDISDDLPDFILDFELDLSQVQVDLEIAAIKPSATPAGAPVDADPVVKEFLLMLKITDGPVKLSYFQIHSTTKSGQVRSYRLVNVVWDKLPSVPSVPLVGQVNIPVDAMSFAWVSDDISTRDVTTINAQLTAEPGCHIWCKPQEGGQTAGSAQAPALFAGSHFLLIATLAGTQQVIIDQCFGRPKPKPAAPSGDGRTVILYVDTSPIPADDQPATAKVLVTIGPLNIRAIRFAIRKGKNASGKVATKIGFSLDASFKLGPIELNLVDFCILLDMTALSSPAKLLGQLPSIELSGLGLEYVAPPVVMTGFLRFQADMFAGGIQANVSELGIMAVGEYASVIDHGSIFKTAFAFARIEGPLFEIGIAELNGLSGGFGYNSDFIRPAVVDVPLHPFVAIPAAGQAGDDPAKQIATLFDGGYVRAKNESFWIAAGMQAKAMQILDLSIVAYLVVSASPRFGVLAECVAILPEAVPPSEQLLLLDLGLVAELDPLHGSLIVVAELGSRSFLLDRNCLVTGGFGIAFFFGPSEHSGDWVVCVGGYHPRYVVPTHYPRPSAIGLAWHFSNEIHISGQAYFAFAPVACMAGGRLDFLLAMDFFDLRASFSAWADFFVQYRPLLYKGDVGVSLHITARVGWKYFSKTISLEASADLQLAGPPMHGHAQIHLWFWDFDIDFGHAASPPRPASLSDFLQSLKPKPRTEEDPGDHVLSLKSGGLGGASSADNEWTLGLLNGSFEIQSRIPLGAITCGNALGILIGPLGPIHSRAMRLTDSESLTSTTTVSFASAVYPTRQPTLRVDLAKSMMPASIWGSYDAKNANGEGSTESSLIEAITGLTLSVTSPVLSNDELPPVDAALKSINAKIVAKTSASFPTRALLTDNPVAAISAIVNAAKPQPLLDGLESLYGIRPQQRVDDLAELSRAFLAEPLLRRWGRALPAVCDIL